MKRVFLLFIGVLLLAIVELPADQHRHIEAVPTRVGQQGTTVEVLIQGNYINDPREIIFYRRGIKAVEIKQLKDLEHPVSLPHSGDAIVQQVTAKFVIAADCPIGEHSFKLRTGNQLSTLSTFWVTAFPVYKEKERAGKMGVNDSAESAEKLTNRSVTVHGKIDSDKTSDVDVYRVSRKKGERISVEIDSVRLTEMHYAESEFDLVVSILDSSGKSIAEADDSSLHIQDPILSVLAPADGDYLIAIQQSLYKPSPYVHYLAHIGDFERPLAVYPAGGEAGKELEVSLLGDPSGAVKQRVTLPVSDRSIDHKFWQGEHVSLLMRVSPYPNVLESSGGISKIPIALNGIISKAGETDSFFVDARKGQAYRLRVFARSLGTPLDPQIEIVHAKSGEVEVRGDDASQAERGLWAMARSFQVPTLLDPSVLWTPKFDGKYEIKIRDMRGLGGAHFIYRAELEPVENAVHTWMYAKVIDSAECSKMTAITIPQGNRWALNVRLAEGQGNPWKGDFRLVAEGLPEGVQMNAAVVKAGQSEVLVEFVALPGTQAQGGVFRLKAEPVEKGVEVVSSSQQVMPFLSHSGARAWHIVTVDQYAYAVTDPAPFRLEVESPKIPLSKNGEVFVKVKLHREPGFTEPVEVNAYWVPAGVTAQPAARFGKGESEMEFSFQANSSVTPEQYSLTLQATTLRGVYFNGVGDIRVSAPFFDLTIADSYVELESEPVAIRRNGKSDFTFKVSHKKTFEGQAEVVLLGLPKGVTAATVKLSPGQETVVFKLQADGEALLGQYKQLTCELTVTEAGQEVRQRSGNGILRVDPALSTVGKKSSKK